MGPAGAQLRARIPSIPSGSIFGIHWGPTGPEGPSWVPVSKMLKDIFFM